ncbi:MAG: hypothetical protein AB1609_16860 [Bacillota bacterium]
MGSAARLRQGEQAKDTFTLSEMNEVQRKLAQTLNLEAMHRLAS